MTDPLERPVWNMLNGPQAGLAVASGAAVRLDPGYGPFAAARDRSDEAQAALATIVNTYGVGWLVEPEAQPAPRGTTAARVIELTEMVADGPASAEADPAFDCTLLGETDASDMAALVAATDPGPWANRSHRYGVFYGLRRDGRLVAMAGERMWPAPHLREISGVCTLPEMRGQGLAGLLVRRMMADMRARGQTPFLHSKADNPGAIRLYESLGFKVRRPMVVTVLVPG